MRPAGATSGVAFGVLRVALVTIAWQQNALAQEAAPASDRIRLEYRAPPECPSNEAFLESVRSRAGSEWEAKPEELARPIDVEVSRTDNRYVASIRFSSTAGEKLVRQVTGQSCGDVVNGIALVTALAIRSQVSDALEQSEAPTPAVKPPTPSPKPAAKPAPVSRPPAPVAARVRTGVSGSVVSGVGPDVAFGAAVFGVVEVSELRFGLSAQLNDSGEDTVNGVPVRFRLVAFRLDGCPVAFELAPWFALEPCASFELGWLEGSTTRAAPPRVVRPETSYPLWAAPGLLLRGVLRFDPGFLQLEGFGRVPLLRETFYVETAGDPDVVYEVPRLAWGASAGLGVRF